MEHQIPAPAPSADLTSLPAKAEVILTPVQARQIKMKKGYALEPVSTNQPGPGNEGSSLGRGQRRKHALTFATSPRKASSRRTIAKREALLKQLEMVNKNIEAVQHLERDMIRATHQSVVPLNAPELPPPSSSSSIVSDEPEDNASAPQIPNETQQPNSPSPSFETSSPQHMNVAPENGTQTQSNTYSSPASHDASQAQFCNSELTPSQPPGFPAPSPSPASSYATQDLVPTPFSLTSTSRPKQASKKPRVRTVSGIEAAPELVDTPRQKRQKRPRVLLDEECARPEPPFYAGCRLLVKTIRTHKDSVPFHEPVNTDLVRDYKLIVKNPMDLSKISQKLADRVYETYDQFAADMRLIFSNCLLYNRRDTPYAQAALAIEQVFDSEELKLKSKGKLENEEKPKMRGNRRKKTTVAQEDVVKLQQQLQLIQNQLQGIHGQHIEQTVWDVSNPKGKRKSSSGPRKPRTKRDPRPQLGNEDLPATLRFVHSESESDDEAPMSYEQKCELSEKINALPANKIGRVVQIIQDHVPALSETNPEEIEIDIDALDNSVLRHLESYVNSCLPPSRRKTPKKQQSQGSMPQAVPGSQPMSQEQMTGEPVATFESDMSAEDENPLSTLPTPTAMPMPMPPMPMTIPMPMQMQMQMPLPASFPPPGFPPASIPASGMTLG